MAEPAMEIYIEVDGESVLLEELPEQERLRISQRLQECLMEPLGYREALCTLFHRLPNLKKTVS